ncbi:GTP-binding protein [Bartonella sp. HY038]|uniref:CobW family GTP-binding protein n=1 Tax=Bartonella sp. HY038 TaxID=2759660 RepID=UPI0015FB1836|nr:GTP-binding protein [Bartonella sp. HY038]
MIPIHIITGFLGSGKTSFIKQLLKNGSQENTLVLINEFGSIGIDDIMVQNISENTYLMPNGCICCAVLSDLKMTLFNVLNKRNNKEIPYFDKILIETTGLANPASLLATILNDVHLKGSFSMNGLTTIVDAEHARLQYDLHPEWLTQVVASHQIFISKVDRVEHQELIFVQKLIEALNPDANLILKDNMETMKQLFLRDENLKCDYQKALIFNKDENKIHNQAVSFTITHDKPINWLIFGLWLNLLLKKHGENILRVKGILNLEDSKNPILIHGVQHCLYPPEHLECWPWDDQFSRLVFIVRNIERENIVRSFKAFTSLT